MARFSSLVLWEFLEDYRYQNNLTQIELCQRLGWQSTYYSRLKHDKMVNSETVMSVSEKLLVPLKDIVKGDKAYIRQALSEYPPEIMKWIVTDEGKRRIIDAYRDYLNEITK